MTASRVCRATVLLCCALAAFRNALDLLDTEFGGGQLTGPLLRLCLVGGVSFLIGSLLALIGRPVGIGTLISGALCAPLYVERIAPDALGWLTAAPASVVTGHLVSWDAGAAIGLLTLAMAATICVPRRRTA